MRDVRAWAFLSALLLLAGCDLKFEKNAPAPSRIVPPGQGPVAHFDVHPQPGEHVQISSRDVHAQRDGDKLILHFDTIGFARNPNSDKPKIEVDDVRVRVSRPVASGRQHLADSNRRNAGNKVLTPFAPKTEISDAKFEVDGVGQQCQSGCVVILEASWYTVGGITSTTSKSGSASESVPVELHLESAQAGGYKAPLPEPEAPPVGSSECSKLVSEQEASEILGEPVAFQQSDRGCELRPGPGGHGMSASWSITEDVAAFETNARAGDAIPMPTLGERAYARRSDPVLFVLKSGRVLGVSVTDARPAELREEKEISRKTISLARKIVSRM